jgi:hypothetical protein
LESEDLSWANASYFPAVSAHFGGSVRTGKLILRFARQDDELSSASRAALRRYSTSWQSGCEDGKTLNASLARGDGLHDEWARDLDGAFVWSFTRDVVVWRGGDIPMGERGGPSFVSTSLVERSARKFRDRGGLWISAIMVPAGFRVAIPSMVWSEGDDVRTLGVVRNEVEIVLPRGAVLVGEGRIRPFGEHEGRRRVSVGCYRVAQANGSTAA